MNNDQIVDAVRHWVETLVVGLNLCPFAKRELAKNRVRFLVSSASSEEQLLGDLESELILLESDNHIETTLLIHPRVLQDFYDYNQFLDYAEGLVTQMNMEGLFQIASFHPEYQFAGTEADDVENYTNRAPFPLLHLLREESLERAVDSYPQVEQIPDRNIERLNDLGQDKVHALLRSCFEHFIDR